MKDLSQGRECRVINVISMAAPLSLDMFWNVFKTMDDVNRYSRVKYILTNLKQYLFYYFYSISSSCLLGIISLACSNNKQDIKYSSLWLRTGQALSLVHYVSLQTYTHVYIKSCTRLYKAYANTKCLTLLIRPLT